MSAYQKEDDALAVFDRVIEGYASYQHTNKEEVLENFPENSQLLDQAEAYREKSWFKRFFGSTTITFSVVEIKLLP